MPPHRTAGGASGTRRPARDIIDAVVENMRKNLEPLKYSTLAPSRYVVYLHPSEYSRLDGIIPILQEQTTRALAEELERLNRRAPVRRWVDRWRGGPEPQIRNAGPDWQVEFLADPDGDMNEGDLLMIRSSCCRHGAIWASASAPAGSPPSTRGRAPRCASRP